MGYMSSMQRDMPPSNCKSSLVDYADAAAAAAYMPYIAYMLVPVKRRYNDAYIDTGSFQDPKWVSCQRVHLAMQRNDESC